MNNCQFIIRSHCSARRIYYRHEISDKINPTKHKDESQSSPCSVRIRTTTPTSTITRAIHKTNRDPPLQLALARLQKFKLVAHKNPPVFRRITTDNGGVRSEVSAWNMHTSCFINRIHSTSTPTSQDESLLLLLSASTSTAYKDTHFTPFTPSLPKGQEKMVAITPHIKQRSFVKRHMCLRG